MQGLGNAQTLWVAWVFRVDWIGSDRQNRPCCDQNNYEPGDTMALPRERLIIAGAIALLGTVVA